MCKWEDNIKTGLDKYDERGWTRLIELRIGTSGGLL